VPLYFDQIWLDTTTPEGAKRSYTALRNLVQSGSFPEGVKLVAGPWFSNEEAKVILILDIQDHTKTFMAFGAGVTNGLVRKRRLEPIVEVSAVDSLLAAV
jgi:hypothetical protein